MQFPRSRAKNIKPNKPDEKTSPLKKYESLWTPLITPILTASLSLVGVAWQLNAQSQQVEKTQLLEGAQNTAQETSRLLNDGYNALTKFLDDSHEKTWEEIKDHSWLEFMEFHQKWRQQLIAHHFKLVRYFGKDVADELIRVDEIDLHPIPPNLSSPNLCTPLGGENNLDMQKLAQITECYMRMAALSQSSAEKEMSRETISDFLENMEAYGSLRKSTQKLLKEYDKTTVRLLRALETRLIQFQGGPYVIIKAPSE